MSAFVEHSPFDPKKAVTFDLPNGQVRLTAGPSSLVAEDSHRGIDNGRAVIVPAAALGALAATAGEAAARELGRSIGRALGARVHDRLDVHGGSLDAVVSELATELAIVGLGTLSLERWGRALVVCISDAPLSGVAGDALLAAAVEGMLASASGRTVCTTPLARDGQHLRVLVGNVASIERVIGWLAEGVAWGDAITRLHAPTRVGEEVVS
jgi:hypothetical protein